MLVSDDKELPEQRQPQTLKALEAWLPGRTEPVVYLPWVARVARQPATEMVCRQCFRSHKAGTGCPVCAQVQPWNLVPGCLGHALTRPGRPASEKPVSKAHLLFDQRWVSHQTTLSPHAVDHHTEPETNGNVCLPSGPKCHVQRRPKPRSASTAQIRPRSSASGIGSRDA